MLVRAMLDAHFEAGDPNSVGGFLPWPVQDQIRWSIEFKVSGTR